MDNTDIVNGAFQALDNYTGDGPLIDLGGIVTLPQVKTDVNLSEQTKVFVIGVLVIVGIFVFKPFAGSSRRRR